MHVLRLERLGQAAASISEKPVSNGQRSSKSKTTFFSSERDSRSPPVSSSTIPSGTPQPQASSSDLAENDAARSTRVRKSINYAEPKLNTWVIYNSHRVNSLNATFNTGKCVNHVNPPLRQRSTLKPQHLQPLPPLLAPPALI
jgi:hypothetical protein